MTIPIPAWQLPKVVAHRCGGSLAPENTLAGLGIARALGVAAVEFDVMLSADGSPWLIHDETLERTTNASGAVCEARDSALRLVDAGAYRHPSFAGEALPTFAATAARCRELGLMANVEIKPATGFEAITGEVVARAILQLWDGTPLPLVSSFSEASLVAARRVAPELPLGYLCERPPADWFTRLEAVDGYSLHCCWDQLADDILIEARARGVPVLCWTVNRRADAEALLARGVTSVIADRIDLMLGL